MKLENGECKNTFICAINGIKQSLKSEKNLKIDFIIAIFVIIAGFIFKINFIEWIICIISIGLVISAEIMNTAVETIVDMFTREKNELAGKAKDMAAGSVLLIAITTAIVGTMIFLPKICNFFIK